MEQVICLSEGTKNHRVECFQFITNLISSIVIEDLALEIDNEIKQFLLSQKEVACFLSPGSATLVAIGPNAVILITELKKQI